ncbi:hypothetical protein [Nonomuraea soli]|uniref:Uncharacterized protein n=1 Tax=Nonomuraea soli TaxID=1032476 RepID=A0A7W0HQD7_9ACTN|nr:hypothetical protein [Nonomuraea soli]MBA2891536.1 hypothetical protein [Nonomuraea soli]
MNEDTPGSLRARWRKRSMRAGWSMPGDWWVPAVEQAGEAVLRGHDVVRACLALGDARARAGVGIAEGMTDLAALYASLGLEPPFEALRSFAAGWTEATFAPMAELSCEDPLTGLVTVAYLRTRLAELYRGATAGRHRLVVAEPLRRGEELAERLAATFNLAEQLRSVFPGGQTLALLGSARVGALTPHSRSLSARVRLLHGMRVRVLRLPGRYEEALKMLRSLR